MVDRRNRHLVFVGALALLAALLAGPVWAGEANQALKAATTAAPTEAAPADDLAAATAEREARPLGPAPAPGGTRPIAPSGQNSWVLNTITALGVVLGLILGVRVLALRAAGRTAASSRSRAVEVLTRVSVAPKNHILLVRLGKRVLAVGDSVAGLRTLADIDDPEEVSQLLQQVASSRPNSITRGFGQFLERFNGQYKADEEVREEGADAGEHRLDQARDQLSGLRARLRAMAKGGDA